MQPQQEAHILLVAKFQVDSHRVTVRLSHIGIPPMISGADKIIDLYERHAHDYAADRRSVGWSENAWLDRKFSALLPRGATGTIRPARAASARFLIRAVRPPATCRPHRRA